MILWDKFLKFLDRKVETFGAQYKNFGLFGAINFPLSYFILHFIGTNENAILRLIGCLLCIPLIFTKYWPTKAKKYLNLYWFLTLLYYLPMFGVYMLLGSSKNL